MEEDSEDDSRGRVDGTSLNDSADEGGVPTAGLGRGADLANLAADPPELAAGHAGEVDVEDGSDGDHGLGPGLVGGGVVNDSDAVVGDDESSSNEASGQGDGGEDEDLPLLGPDDPHTPRHGAVGDPDREEEGDISESVECGGGEVIPARVAAGLRIEQRKGHRGLGNYSGSVRRRGGTRKGKRLTGSNEVDEIQDANGDEGRFEPSIPSPHEPDGDSKEASVEACCGAKIVRSPPDANEARRLPHRNRVITLLMKRMRKPSNMIEEDRRSELCRRRRAGELMRMGAIEPHPPPLLCRCSPLMAAQALRSKSGGSSDSITGCESLSCVSCASPRGSVSGQWECGLATGGR